MDIRTPEFHLGLFFDVTHEPLLLHRPGLHNEPGRVVLGIEPLGGRFRTKLVDVDQLGAHLAELEPSPNCSYYLSQHTMRPGAKTRRATDVAWLNALWLDIDLLHPPASYERAQLPFGAGLAERFNQAPEELADLLCDHLHELGLPAPTLTIDTGRGLSVKWLLEQPLAAQSDLHRWKSLQAQLCQGVAKHNFGTALLPRRWPVDQGVRDPSRVLRLVGTTNPASGKLCRMLRTGQRVDFDLFAEWLPPVAVAPAQRRPRARDSRDASTDLAITGVVDAAATGLWARRLRFGLAVIRHRGGAQSGERNDSFWILANALAWCAGGVGDLRARLERLHKGLFAGGAEPWTREEAAGSASSVMSRLDQGKEHLYKMRAATFLRRLSVTPPELQQFGQILTPRSKRNHGAMGLPPLRGLTPEEFAVAKRARQKQGGRFTQAQRREKRGVDGGTLSRAIQLASQGESRATIARELDVSERTVRRWLKKHDGLRNWLVAQEAAAIATRQLEAEAEAASRRQAADLLSWLRDQAGH